MDWSGWQNKADKMIGKYGKAMRIKISTQATYNASSDGYTSATTSYPVMGLFTSFEDKDDENRTISSQEGHATIIENAFILVPAKGLPRIDQMEKVEIIDGSKTYQPIDIVPIQPGGTAIIYRLQVK